MYTLHGGCGGCKRLLRDSLRYSEDQSGHLERLHQVKTKAVDIRYRYASMYIAEKL